MATYVYTVLLSNVIDSALYSNITSTTTIRNVINRGIRKTIADIDMRSTKRKGTALKFFDDVYSYTCPTDLKDRAIIDIIPQGERDASEKRVLTSEERFDRQKSIYSNLVAVSDNSLVRKVRASLDTQEDSILISDFTSLTEGTGTWTLFGDGESLAIDTSNYITNGACLSWNISAAGGTTAGAYISGIGEYDVSDYKSDGSAFMWIYIYSATNLTNWILRLGSDSSNYYSMTATTQADGTAFVAGWNLIKWDFSGKTTTGTPDDDACDYVACYMTKAGAKVSETGYRFDRLELHSGWYNSILYYSKYGWQTNAAVWIENSTADTDYINCDTEELDIFVEACKFELFRDLKDYDQMNLAKAEYERLKKNYKLKYPSERLKMEQYYY